MNRLPNNLAKRIEPIPETGCWIWTGALFKNGYGRTRNNKRALKAHRVVYEELVGPVPDGLVIDHLCRMRCCVNPAHLEPVSERVNILRGVSPTAINSRKTHCIHGHELTPDNIYPGTHGYRYCRICRVEEKRAYRVRKKLKAIVDTVLKEEGN